MPANAIHRSTPPPTATHHQDSFREDHITPNQKIAIFGGTRYTGHNIARQATRRGLAVTAISRTALKDSLPGVAYVQGSISDDALVTKLAAEHGIVVVAMRAADGVLSARLSTLTKAVIAGESRWGHVNGAGSALVAPGGPRLIDTPEFPAAYKAEAAPCASVFDWLRNEAPAELNWFAITPAAGYSSSNPGEALGRYRKGGDLLVVGDEGKSHISGADFALAFVDEIAAPTLHRARTTVGY